jgi:hypothetical protein
VSIGKADIMLRISRQSLFIAFVFAFAAACSQDEEVNRNTVEFFETHLQLDMNHAKLISVFGGPVKDLGSGIHIYVYNLDDNTEVWVGITDKLLYANHVDKNKNLLKVLI